VALIYAEDCRAAGIEPRVGTWLLFRDGAHPKGACGAIDIERLG